MSIERGYTLIELLVVVMIIALGASLAALNIGGTAKLPGLRLVAIEFTNRSHGLLQEVIITGQVWGVDLYRDEQTDSYGYRWLKLENNVWVQRKPEGLEAFYLLPTDVVLELEIEGSHRDIEWFGYDASGELVQDFLPDIALLGSGEATPFVLRFLDNHSSQKVEIIGDLLGRITRSE
ncbi:prepilin-type N-terminal cleavage/methylation domain-containing protein [Motiliproteus coralliicola]|uniref:Prepilin-type N-terminal cleavage/methylation domain-containing protein n=1 Tax=Motiliproteus coralliicola TaxID=2283196 RepID=A0A369WSA5_9GAMM|nr:prepilin-type N-terminal cleavage/methylation domain-containing protein [Motiliproteus coralliicola]RDE22365.1 prepilin-type N-terminal cleavage/methylation domain-containing protein [Motiliproteus coralliicola]